MDPSHSGSLGRPGGVVDSEFFQKYEAMKEEYESMRKRCADLMSQHSGIVNKLELSQEEVNRLKKVCEEALQETDNAIRERNGLKQQCTAAIRQWDSALRERTEYKEALSKVQQQHEEAMKEVNQGMARSIKSSKELKRLTEERDAALQEYSLIMSERDSVHRELEKLNDDLTQSKKQIKTVEAQNQELMDKVQEAGQEAEVSNRTRDWAFSERDKIMREKESLRTLCESLRREKDKAVSDLAEALGESEEIKRQKNLAVKQLKELRDRIEAEKDKESRTVRLNYLSNSSSFSESRDSAIDSDLPSGHYSIKLPNMRGADHGLVLEPGVYISRIVPGSPAAKLINLNIGDRVLYINDTPINNVQDAILALSEDIDPIMLTLSRSSGQLASPLHTIHKIKGVVKHNNGHNGSNANSTKISNHASTSSLKSDKSDHQDNFGGGGHQMHPSGIGLSSTKGHGGFRDIFKVKLPRKKLPSEAEALETLDSAIASGSSSSHRKARKKRGTSRGGSGGENATSNKNGTWPRVFLNRNSACSYTLPHNGANNQNNNSGSGGGGGELRNTSTENHYATLRQQQQQPQQNFYSTLSHYAVNPNQLSNTVCVRRPATAKERASLHALGWDINPEAFRQQMHQQQLEQQQHALNSKSVGSINNGGNNAAMSLPNNGNQESMSLTRNKGVSSLGGHDIGLRTRGGSNQVPQHYRYSIGGVFEQSADTRNKIGKGDPQRNSVVPTLSDGSSIDFSVKSGDIMEYYVKRNMGKNHNNSSESDHLDKVVTPPSLMTMPSSSIGSGSSSNVLSSSLSGTNTLNRFSNRFTPSRYSSHHTHHDSISQPLGIPSMNIQMSHPLQIPTIPHNPKTIQSTSLSNNSFTFEPNFSQHHSHHHNLLTGGNSGHTDREQHSSTPMTLHSNSKLQMFRNSDDLLLHPSYPIEPSGTFPRKKEPQRIRIPSNQSVTSRSSTEKFEMRNSPMPTYHIEVLDPGNSAHGASDFGSWRGRSGELRSIRIDKSAQPLGIQISCKAKGGGVFVSSVNEGSVAAQANLKVGDQLLEICGINMRSATFAHAAQVLHQCKDTITILVQYLPDKYHSLADENGSSSEGEFHSDGSSSSEHEDDENNSSGSENESRSSGRSTPCNTPQSTLVRKSAKNSSTHSGHSKSNTLPSKSANHSTHNSLTNSLKAHHLQQQQQQSQQAQLQQALNAMSLSSGDKHSHSVPHTPSGTLTKNSATGTLSDGSEASKKLSSSGEKPRYLNLQLMKNSSNLGICLVGGNIVGIYVHSVLPESIADRAGLRTGDQILEYNGTDLRQATAEEAAFELAKPLDKVNVLVQYNIQKYNEIKDQPGDGFYIRALFDYPSLSNDPHFQSPTGSTPDAQHLTFHKDEILYVDNTMWNGKPGKWRAWKIDSEGHRRIWGIIPSKFKIEEDLMFKRSLGDLDGDRRSSTVTRRSFFRRKSHHRSSSRELASFSDFSINSYGDLSNQPGSAQLEPILLSSYQRVERLDYMLFLRPVLVLGALSDVMTERLVQDFPYQFGRVAVEAMHCSGAMLENGLAENIIVDYKRKGSHYECITMAAIKEISCKKLYCILDISTAGIERLQHAQMYPIVLLVKFKNPKQIREIKDLRCDKITAKAAKELYEHSLKVESEYKHLITACIPGGTNISYLATQAKTAIEKEQSKTLWVPT